MRVLLVDDMVDTGKTFSKVYDHLKSQFADITELRSAVLWWKGHSLATPDYYVEKLPTNPWIHQPFEDYDGLRPHQHPVARNLLHLPFADPQVLRTDTVDRPLLRGLHLSCSLPISRMTTKVTGCPPARA